MPKVRHHILASIVLYSLLSTSASALDFSLGISGTNVERFNYEIGLLELALEKADGEHTISIVTLEGTPRSRMVTMLASNDTDFNVMVTGITSERHALLKTVPVPLMRGLLGYRILIVRDESADAIKEIETFEELKQISIGSGTDWPDTLILREAGLQITSADYENLFQMVSMGRIQAYARGVLEPYIELEDRADIFPNLKVDDTIALVYPFDAFFFVNQSDTSRYEILLQGLERAYEDESFLTYFENSQGFRYATEHAKIGKRKRFYLENRSVPDLIEAIPSHYWYSGAATN
jgi:hypothetical protein